MISELGSIVLNTHSLGGFTDEEFYQFCLDNRDLKFERDANQNIIIMSNTGGKTGNYNAELLAELIMWNRSSKKGICFDSSTGFKLPNGAVRSPDAAWIKLERWNTLSEKQKEQFPPLCPDFVIEIKSSSDNIQFQKNKMEEWVANGCRVGWLIHPEERTTHVYSNGLVTKVSFEENLSDQEILSGFEIKMKDLFH